MKTNEIKSERKLQNASQTTKFNFISKKQAKTVKRKLETQKKAKIARSSSKNKSKFNQLKNDVKSP